MKKIIYILRSFRTMGLGRMWVAAREVAWEYRRFAVVIFMDMIWCALRYGAGQTDYRAMQFARMPGWRRRTFVTRGVNNEYIRRLNHREAYCKMENKVHFNRIFAPYIRRDWINLAEASPQDFEDFTRRRLEADGQRPKADEQQLEADEQRLEADGQRPEAGSRAYLIVKPVDKLCGQGIERIEVTAGTDTHALYTRLLDNGQHLVEECIVQHPALAALYPPSVNTLRLVTVRADDGVHFIIRILRTGVGGNVVDNTDVGGLYMFTDEAGEVITPAINYKEETYDAHPDTGAALLGFRVPFFAEAVAMVCEAAQVVPGIRYVGWDVAITADGPVLVEANHNPAHSGFQKVIFMGGDEPGKRPRFAQIFENIR